MSSALLSRGLHPFFKQKHSLGRIFFHIIIRHMMVWEPFIKKGNDMEAASVHIEMDVSLFKIWGTSDPYFGLRITHFDFPQDGRADTFALYTVLHE